MQDGRTIAEASVVTEWAKAMEELSSPVKDAFQAEVFRRKGNRSYKDKDLKEALKLYNKV